MIKIKVLAWVEENDELFVIKFFDTVKRDHYYRAAGGTVEFGELTLDTLHREIREELGTGVKVIGTPLIFENIFVCDGIPGHEIAYFYPCEFTDLSFYERKLFKVIEGKNQEMIAAWVPIKSCLSGKLRLVPEGLLDWYREKYSRT